MMVREEVDYSSTHSLTSSPHGGQRMRRLLRPRRQNLGNHWIGCWVEPEQVWMDWRNRKYDASAWISNPVPFFC